jgi:Domain of unknown function (DUF4383)
MEEFLARVSGFSNGNPGKAGLSVGPEWVSSGIQRLVRRNSYVQFARAPSAFRAFRPAKALLLGVFQISILPNIVHLLFGVVGILIARSFGGARAYLIVGGVIYLMLFLYGLPVGQDSVANFVPVNAADDILHLVLGIGMIGLGVALSRGRTATTVDSRTRTT